MQVLHTREIGHCKFFFDIVSGSPTNPTPPESLTSEDSSYMSARDSSSNSISRVRFSPNTITDIPCHSHSQDSNVSLNLNRRPYSRESSRSRRPSDYDRDYHLSQRLLHLGAAIFSPSHAGFTTSFVSAFSYIRMSVRMCVIIAMQTYFPIATD